MTTTAHPLDFDEQKLDDYYTQRDAITALIDDDTSVCGGWGCVDGCADCMRGCEWCRITHSMQDCPEIRALLLS